MKCLGFLPAIVITCASAPCQTVSSANVQLQHGVNRSVEAFSLDTVSVGDYGALGDGASHPACTALGLTTLAQLQAYKSGIYSFATACTNQLDWLTSQYAVNLVTSSGGRVVFPSGTYTFDQPLILPNDFDTTKTAKGIYLRGTGAGATFIQPSIADFGAGSALISCGPIAATYSDNSGTGSGRYTSTGGCFGGIEDISLINPGQTSYANVTSTTYAGGVSMYRDPPRAAPSSKWMVSKQVEECISIALPPGASAWA